VGFHLYLPQIVTIRKVKSSLQPSHIAIVFFVFTPERVSMLIGYNFVSDLQDAPDRIPYPDVRGAEESLRNRSTLDAKPQEFAGFLTESDTTGFREAPLNAVHRSLGAKMGDFGGWDAC
jgi:hypothetical protein